MPIYSSYREALEAWKETLPRSLLVTGKDDFTRKEAEQALTQTIVERSSPEVVTFTGQTSSALLQELATLSFFTASRLFVITQFDKLDKALLPHIATPPPNCYLLFSTQTMRKDSIFYKKMGGIVTLPELKPWEKERQLLPWLQRQAQHEGKRVDNAAAQLLLSRVGPDEALLLQELRKIACYVGSRDTINSEDVRATTLEQRHEDGWQLGEAIFSFDSKAALRTSHQLLDNGVAIIAILRQLRSQFQTDARIASLVACKEPPAAITQLFPYMRGQILNRHLAVARDYGIDKLLKGVIAIDAAELDVKSGTHNPYVLMETLIAKLTTR